MILVTLLAFLIGSKLVNEQYALVVFPFAFLEARRVGGAWRWLARLLWVVPLLFAIVRVQIDRFLWLLYRSIWGAAAKAIAVTAKTGFSGQFVPWSNLNEAADHHSGAGGGFHRALPGGILLAAAPHDSTVPPFAGYRAMSRGLPGEPPVVEEPGR